MAESQIPIQHVVAFNMVSAPAHIGCAIGQRIDGSLDGEPDISIVVMAKNRVELDRALAYLNLTSDMSKSVPAALIHTKNLRVHPIGAIAPASPYCPPEVKQANPEEEW